ncbi:MAG: hypothetical protein M1831_004581 [Alyxoria varia]|nr:MAG: hypothetical protein M1831_004581 [Alyxoria varia]
MAQTPSPACCNTPPIVGKGYKPKGDYITVDGMKTYTTGPKTAKQAILVVYDIFGFFPQTLQGADILAHSDESSLYQVFMPDFFEGKPADIAWYPPDTKEKGEKLGEFFSTTAAPPKTVGRLSNAMKELKDKHPDIKDWGIVGYCWGGKIVNLVSQQNTMFKVAASAHPAMVDSNDAKQITIPFIHLPSKGENKEDVENYQKNLNVKNELHWFPDQEHGFMAARGDLEDKNVVTAYEKGYQLILNFFHQHISSTSFTKI